MEVMFLIEILINPNPDPKASRGGVNQSEPSLAACT
jgi:hypothetical protein